MVSGKIFRKRKPGAGKQEAPPGSGE